MRNDKAVGLAEIFKKQGGWKLIKQYWMRGSLLTAIGEFLLLGSSRTALEILNLSVALKGKQKLAHKFRSELLEFDRNFDCSLPHESSNKVWICWFQGIENAPVLVQRCYQSIKKAMPDRDIVVLTAQNISEYVVFPDYILEKWKKGIISNAHMADLLRLELLIQYGGLWLDATVFCSGGVIEPYYFDSDLFFYQCMKPGRAGHSVYMSNWLIGAKTNNKILMATRLLCYEYWKKYNEVIDYFFFHDFMSIVLEYYPEDWNRIIPKDSATPHILLLRLFDRYDEQIWNAVKAQTPFHKLSYRFTEEQMMIEGTYFQKLFAKEGE